MKRLSLILSLIFLVSLSSLGYAGVNFGMTGAIKERVEKLDETVKAVKEPTEEEKEEAKLKVEEASGLFEDAMDLLGESQTSGDENYETAVESLKKTNSLFKEALEKDPNNPEANLGAAITEILLLGEDTEIKEAIEKLQAWLESFGGSFMGSPIFMAKRLQTSQKGKAMSAFDVLEDKPPTMSELQDIIKNKVLPEIDYIIKRLEVVENSSWESTTYEVTLDSEAIKDFISSSFDYSEMFDSEDGEDAEGIIDEILAGFSRDGEVNVEIDKTDVYVYNGMLQLFKSVLSGFCAWNLDIVYEDFEDPEKTKTAVMKIIEKQSPYKKFLTLKDSEMLKTAGNSLDASAAKLLTAMDLLENETDDQQNDLIPQPDTYDEVWEKVKHALNQVRDALKGPTTIDFTYYDPEADIPELKINLDAFYFTSQIQDLRDYIIPAVEKWPWDPPYSEEPEFKDIDGDGLTPDWNDPTFNGILPEMTNEKLNEYMLSLNLFQ
ncbi:MAG: hypothetical protein QME81_06315 [bacterium]|nr:hypothetical protein [bacterium]